MADQLAELARSPLLIAAYVHKSPRAAKAIAERGAWLLFLPKYSPDLN